MERRAKALRQSLPIHPPQQRRLTASDAPEAVEDAVVAVDRGAAEGRLEELRLPRNPPRKIR
jgi:hypothetical protein